MAQYITDVFLVTGHDSDMSTFILETNLHGYDGNLFESTWRNKAKRFIGFKRNTNDDYVVSDILLISEDKDIPDDYVGCLITTDTKERGLRKHILCFKRDERKTVAKALTEINIIAKGSPVPAFYTAISTSLNENQIIFKVDEVTQPIPARRPVPQSTTTVSQHHSTVASASPNSPVTLLDGVPFQINPKYSLNAAEDPILHPIHSLTIQDIMSKFDYTFASEKRVVNS